MADAPLMSTVDIIFRSIQYLLPTGLLHNRQVEDNRISHPLDLPTFIPGTPLHGISTDNIPSIKQN